MTPSALEATYKDLRAQLAEATQDDAAALRSFDKCYRELTEDAHASAQPEGLYESAPLMLAQVNRRAMQALVDEYNDCLPEDAESLALVYTE